MSGEASTAYSSPEDGFNERRTNIDAEALTESNMKIQLIMKRAAQEIASEFIGSIEDDDELTSETKDGLRGALAKDVEAAFVVSYLRLMMNVMIKANEDRA